LLAAGGAWLMAGGMTGPALAGLGMLLFTVIASPGYFTARHQRALAGHVAVLAVLTIAAIAGGARVITPPAWRGLAALRSGP
jgi:hypothetical protein